MARRPLVTGEGAKYVAAGKKQQAANSGRSMTAAHNKGMASMYQQSQGSSLGGASDHAPTPPSSTPQHLSSQQFSYAGGGMLPGAAGMSHGAVKRTTAMHPGGAGMGGPRFVVSTPKPKANSGYIPGSGNTKSSGRFGASSTATPASSNTGPATSHWDENAFPGVLPAATKGPRGNADPSVSNALGGKGRRSRSVKQASAGGFAGGGQRGGKMKLAKLIPHASRHAGKLAQHLRSATGSA